MTPAERRHDPLRDGWVLVSPGRASRPWRGEMQREPPAPPAYDPTCQLCPGNVRASGARNPAYEGAFVFDNDFPAIGPASEPAPARMVTSHGGGLHRAETVTGAARVVCFSPRHDRSLGRLADAERRAVIDLWAAQTTELGAANAWVQVFENRGEAMGASNPHPHGQIWAASSVPTEGVREDVTQRAHMERRGRALLDDVRDEERGGPLAVDDQGDWLAIVPYWAAWPFETLLIGPPGTARLDELDDTAREDLASVLGRLLRSYDGLFARPFPYSMGWHQAPFGVGSSAGAGTSRRPDHWRLHAHVYPPLLRAEARKFMVGYELLAEPQRDLTPEAAAEQLRAVSMRDAADG